MPKLQLRSQAIGVENVACSVSIHVLELVLALNTESGIWML